MFSATALLTISLALQSAQPPGPAATPAPDDRPITHFFQNLGTDLVRLPSIDTATVAVIGAGGGLLAHPLDDNLSAWVDEQGVSGYTRIGRTAGDGWIQGSAALVTYGIGLVSGDAETVHIGSDLIRAQALNAVVTRVFKLAAGRKRPGGSSDSMPSGHSSGTFATASVLAAHYGWRAGVPAYAAAGFVAWTRVRDRAHWLSDVVVGAAVGTIAGRTVTRGHETRRWAIVPTASASQVAIHFVRVR